MLNRIEKMPVRPGASDRPVKDIVITSVQILTDPFEAYQERLKARLERQDQSDEARRKREERAKERELDRTTWLGTDLGEKGQQGAVKPGMAKGRIGAGGRDDDDDDEGVGKYLGAGKAKAAMVMPTVNKKTIGIGAGAIAAQQRQTAAQPGIEFGVEKKKRKGAGGFGDFAGW